MSVCTVKGCAEKFKESDQENESHDDEDDFDWEVDQNLPLSSQVCVNNNT